MKVPDNFVKGDYQSIVEKINSGEWVLIVSFDKSEKIKHLENILSDEGVGQLLGNFKCFHVMPDGEIENKLSLEYQVAFYVFVGEKMPYRIYDFDEPDYIDPEDIIQFLDDTTSYVLLEEKEEGSARNFQMPPDI